MFKNIIALLLSYFLPSIEDNQGGEEPADDDSGGEEPADDDSGGEEPADDYQPESQPAKPLSRVQRDIISLRERSQRAEEDLRRAQAELADARRTPASSQPTREQQIWQQEEEVLNDPNADSWQKYSVTAARQSRLANLAAQNALHRAEDLSDKASFDAYKISKPKLYEKYAPKVEELLKDLRSKGQNASRERLLAFIVGQDMLQGKVKSVDAITRKTSQVRGTPTNARSDISTSGGKLSAAEARAKRLENVRI